MAHGDDPDERSSSSVGNEGRLREAALEQRVARLERELAALQRQIGGVGAAQASVAAPVAWTPPPPPPIPVRTEAGGIANAGQRLSSEAWASGANREPAAESFDSFENRLGSQIFNRIGIVIVLIGMTFFLKLAIDRQWIGPAARVIAGLVAGAGLVVWSERFRRKGFAAFSYSLKAVGSGILYLSLWAACQLFHLLPADVALVLMVLVTAWNAYMAWAQDSELLAVYALAGGFATPLLVSTGGNHEVFLFSYLLAIDVATAALVRLKGWPRLLLWAFPITVLFFIGWYAEYYQKDELGLTSLFIAAFGAAFASVAIGRAEVGPESSGRRFASLAAVLDDILLPLANAALVALAGYSVLQDSGNHALLPWLMIVLATAYLGLMRAPQTRTASAIHLSLAVVFLTIAIPLKASGHWITVSWLVEGLALVWVTTRLGTDNDESHAARTLRWLGGASLALGFAGVCVHLVGTAEEFDVPFLNKGTGTAVTGIAVFAAAAWLALHAGANSKGDAKAEQNEVWGRIAMGAVLLIGMTAALMTMREVVFSWDSSRGHPAFATADFWTALMALAVFAGVLWASLRVAKEREAEDFWTNFAVLSTIAFNLIAVLTGVREVSAFWAAPANAWTADAALQQALAISAFLMLYGAALLAVGFWRRNGFLRWQALVLLVFTIGKTFVYDMRSLSQGYRVVSFLGLGALLMAISFAYQKDWLNLREAAEDSSRKTDAEGAK
jgi:uncharacterized membrane protein